MSDPSPQAERPDPTPVNEALRRLHRSAIVSIALCAAGIGIAAFAGPEPGAEPSPRTYSWVALLLAGVAILARRRTPVIGGSLRWFVYGTVVGLLACVGLGVLGLIAALAEERIQVGLLYTLAGALLVLRPPPRLVDPGPEDP